MSEPQILDGVLCPKTNEPLVEYEKYYKAEGFDFPLWKEARSRQISAEDYLPLLNGEEVEMTFIAQKTRKPYTGMATLDLETGKLEVELPEREMTEVPDLQIEGELVYDAGTFYTTSAVSNALWKDVAGTQISAQEYAQMIGGEALGEKTFKRKDGSTFQSTLEWDAEQNKAVFPKREVTLLEDVTCPLSGDPVEDRGLYLHFPGAPDTKCWKTIGGGIEVSPDEWSQLLQGETLAGKQGISSKTDKEFTADLSLGDDGKIAMEFPEKPKQEAQPKQAAAITR